MDMVQEMDFDTFCSILSDYLQRYRRFDPERVPALPRELREWFLGRDQESPSTVHQRLAATVADLEWRCGMPHEVRQHASNLFWVCTRLLDPAGVIAACPENELDRDLKQLAFALSDLLSCSECSGRFHQRCYQSHAPWNYQAKTSSR